jgi:Aminoglycoside-2''-adenylyltransferase
LAHDAQSTTQLPGPASTLENPKSTIILGDLPASGAFDADLVAWDAWRPPAVARLLASVNAPWYIAAGWAIDLFLGAERREHEDLEVAVPADRFGRMAEVLAGLELFVISPDPVAPAVGEGETRRALAVPLAEADALVETTHQTWVLERAAGVWRFDVFREPSDGDTWICRRDASIRMRYDRLIERTREGVPYGRPEVVLLFKAKHARPKDDGDLAAVLPLLEPERRRWLAEALELVHPGHRWLAELS